LFFLKNVSYTKFAFHSKNSQINYTVKYLEKIWRFFRSGLIVMGDLPRSKNTKSGHIVMGDLLRWKKCEKWSHCYGWPNQMKKIWQIKKWSHCYGWPTQMKKMWRVISLLCVTYPNGKNMKRDLIVMSDLSRWKKCEKRSHCNGWPTQMKKNMKSGLIVMDDLSRWKKYEK
jgi:hypothetical protein